MNLYKKEFEITSFDNLKVTIFVIGYKNIGESNIVLFFDDNRVVFSMVIDSYKKGDLNITEKILDDLEIKEVDMVCWTHPHCDHTPGIAEIVEKYYHSGMVIFSPKFFYGNLMDDILVGEAKAAQEAFKKIIDKTKKDPNVKEIMRTISASGDITNNYPMRIVDSNGTQKDFILYFLTPIGRRTDEYYIIKNKAFKKPNELSVSFIISLDGYNFYFGSDTENEHAKEIENHIVESMRWIKVPHHSSLGGQSIVDRLGPNADFAASTVFASGGLPVKSIQDAYVSRNVRLFMTQITGTPEDQLVDYGIVRFDYRFLKDDILVEIKTYANAGEYVSDSMSVSMEE